MRIPKCRAVGKAVGLECSVEMHEIDFVCRVVVDERVCESGDVVDAGAVLHDIELLGGRGMEREPGRVPNSIHDNFARGPRKRCVAVGRWKDKAPYLRTPRRRVAGCGIDVG